MLAIDFHIFSISWKSIATVNFLVTHILQNIFFLVDGTHWIPQYFFPYHGSQWQPSTFWLPTFFKISSFGLMLAIDFHIFSISWKSMATDNFLVTNILQNIFFWVNVSHWLPHFFHIMEVNGYRQLFGYPHSSKYLIFGWWYPLTSTFFFHIMEVNGYHQLFGYPHSSKYLLLGSAEEKLIQVCNNMRVSKRWQNCHFGWTFPLSCMKVSMLDSNKNSSSTFFSKNDNKVGLKW